MKIHEIIAGLKSRNLDIKSHGQTGIDAALRRMEPARPGPAATVAFRALAEAGLDLDRQSSESLSAWLLIVHTLALARWRHDYRRPVGQGLMAMRLSDNRLKQLLSADYETLQKLLPRLARRFERCKEVPGMDFTPLARLAITASTGSERLERARLDIALSYTRFQSESSSTDKRKAS